MALRKLPGQLAQGNQSQVPFSLFVFGERFPIISAFRSVSALFDHLVEQLDGLIPLVLVERPGAFFIKSIGPFALPFLVAFPLFLNLSLLTVFSLSFAIFVLLLLVRLIIIVVVLVVSLS